MADDGMRSSRRGLLGYAGAGVAGLAVGAGGAVAARPGAPAESGAGPVVPGTISPYGEHQPGVTAPTPRANRLIAFDLRPATDAEALGRLLRQWTGSIVALTQGRPAPGDTMPDLAQGNVELAVVVGLGPAVFDLPGLGRSRPDALREVPAFTHDRLQDRWSGGDLLLQIGAADDTSVLHAARRLVLDAQPFATLRWEQVGSWRGLDRDQQPTTGRNLFGQVDGTANLTPDDPLFDSTVWTKEPSWLAGGTTLVVRRIRMDLDTWDELTRDEQEASIGRDLDTGAPLTGGEESTQPRLGARDERGRYVIARDAHVRLSHPTRNGGLRILRRGLNYSQWDPERAVLDQGLIFCSFQADVGQFNAIQARLDGGDALNEWTTAIGSAAFAILPGFTEEGWLGESLLG